jgi:hypothetical protein
VAAAGFKAMPVEFCLQQRLAIGHNRNVLLDSLFSVSTLKKLGSIFPMGRLSVYSGELGMIYVWLYGSM